MIRALTVGGFLILGYDAADLVITGLALIAVVVLLIAAWLYGVFTKEFWEVDPATSARLDEVDQELDRPYPPVPTRTVTHRYEDIAEYPEVGR